MASDVIESVARAILIAGGWADIFDEDHIAHVLAKTEHDEDCDDGEYCDFCWANDIRKQARAALTAYEKWKSENENSDTEI